MIDWFVNVELSILNFLNSIHSPVIDKIFVFITHLGDKGIVWIMIGIVMCFLKQYRKIGFTVLLSLLMMFLIGNMTLKPIIARVRPYEYMDGISLLIPKPDDFSFPSGHTFASFASAVSVIFYNKKLGVCFMVPAILISFSRIYLCVHFPSDILCGAILGIGTAYLSKYIINQCKLTKSI